MNYCQNSIDLITYKKGQIIDLSQVNFIRLQIKAEGLQQQVPYQHHCLHTS